MVVFHYRSVLEAPVALKNGLIPLTLCINIYVQLSINMYIVYVPVPLLAACPARLSSPIPLMHNGKSVPSSVDTDGSVSM